MLKIASREDSSSRFKDIYIHFFAHEKNLRGQLGSTHLTAHECMMLWLLIRGQGCVITRDEMVYFIYDDSEDDIPLGNSTEVVMARVRKKLAQVSNRVIIETVRGMGYRLA